MHLALPLLIRVAAVAASIALGLLACAVLAWALAGPPSAAPAWAAPAATTHTFPGPAPCNTLQGCINAAAAGDTILVQAGAHAAGATLNKAISLTGVASNTAILTAPAGQRVLTVTGAAVGSSVVISGLTFSGGAISATTSCPAGCGGGLLITGTAQPRLVNLIINGNTAWQGGGLYVHTGSLLHLSGSRVSGNTSTQHGGGAYALGDAVLNGGLFQANICTQNECRGGGLRALGGLNLSGTHFISNSARSSGGGAHIAEAAALNGGLFQANWCAQSDCVGGGLRANALALTSTNFIGNTAGDGGGGAYALGAATLNGGLFERNRCTGPCYGGGLFANSSLTASNSQFISNTATLDGGGAFVNGNAVLNGGLFERNRCGDGYACLGGGLQAASALATGTQFISNTATFGGGGVFVSASAVLNGGLFQGNSSLSAGGGLLSSGTLALTGTQFVSNTASAEGGGVYVNVTAVLNGGLFQGNSSLSAGGGLYAASMLATGTQFISNTAWNSGGGAVVPVNAVLNGGLFQGNACLGGTCPGGGLRADALALTGTQFINNASQGSGGGAFVLGAATLNGGLFQDNSCAATGCVGGGVRAGSTLALTGTQFISNTSVTRAGGAFAEGTASVNGGLFQGNSAQEGGGLWMNGSGQVVNGLFAGNRAAAGRGAGLYLASGTVTLLHNTVASATLASGSAIYVGGGNVTALNNLVSLHSIALERAGGTFNQNYTLYAGVANPISGTVGGGADSFAGLAGFANPAGGDFRLGPASDAIDRGTDAGLYVDAFGAPRPVGAGFDIGYHEYDPLRRLYLPLLMR